MPLLFGPFTLTPLIVWVLCRISGSGNTAGTVTAAAQLAAFLNLAAYAARLRKKS